MLKPTGEIEGMTVSWLFQQLRAGKKSGTVVFEQEKLIKKVFFGNGDILFASSNIDGERFGEFLLRTGRITKTQFDDASIIVKKTGKKLGAVLFEFGILSPKDLVEQVKLQVKHIILNLFTWRNGRYRFEEGQLPADEIIPLQMSTGNLILEGIQALDWQLVRRGLPPMKTFLRLSADPSLIFQDADLTADQKNVLLLIDGSRTIEQICSLTGIGDFNTLKAVYLLLALKMAEVGESGTHGEKNFAQDAVSEAAKKTGGALDPDQPVTKQMIQEAYEAMKHQDDFQVLGVNKTMTQQELKKTYFKLAKKYHPDRHFEPEMADMKEKLEALFARIHDAYLKVSESERPQEYEHKTEFAQPPGHFEEKRAEDYVENYARKAGSAPSYFNAGMKEFQTGNFWGAAEAFARATRLDPVQASYFYYFGMSLSHIPRRRHEAEEKLRKAIEIDPLKPEYYLELGTLYLKSGLRTKAMDVFTIALRENPGSEKILQAIKAAGGEPPKGNGSPEGVFKKMFKEKK